MKFFLPGAKGPEDAERILDAIRSFAEQNLSARPADRRIFRVEYVHDGKPGVAQVGEPFEGGETVVAILVSNVYLVCTPNRGVLRGIPILVGLTEATRVEDFEPGYALPN